MTRRRSGSRIKMDNGEICRMATKNIEEAMDVSVNTECRESVACCTSNELVEQVVIVRKRSSEIIGDLHKPSGVLAI